jgi:ribosomal-protein-alanine N-acetyltransferase
VSEPSIVPLQERHLAEVMEIERASFGMPWSQEGLLRVMTTPGSLAYAAEIDGTLVGYVLALRVDEEAEILKLAVHPDVRGQGVARVLNARCIAELKELGCRELYLEVRRSNLAAISLYEGFGFREVGVRKSYYTSPVEDAILMRREL